MAEAQEHKRGLPKPGSLWEGQILLFSWEKKLREIFWNVWRQSEGFGFLTVCFTLFSFLYFSLMFLKYTAKKCKKSVSICCPISKQKKYILKIILSLKVTYKRGLSRLLRVQRHNDCSQKRISLTRDGKEMVVLIVKTVRFKYASRITLCIITNVDGTCLHKIF